MNADVNENVKLLGRVKYENTGNRKDNIGNSVSDTARSWSQDVWLDRVELQWNTGNFQGRFVTITTKYLCKFSELGRNYFSVLSLDSKF